MKVVIDSNVFLIMLPRKSEYRLIFDKFLSAEISLIYSTEILYEYEEIFASKMSAEISENIISLLTNRENTIKATTYFNWHLIINDKDDNKFVDVALAANADYIVTNDAHFNILKTIDFPKINIISSKDFIQLISI